MGNSSVSRFRDNFIYKTKAYTVKPKAVRWYVRHAGAYIGARAGLRLSRHSSRHIEQYLKIKGRNPCLKDWQFCQIIDALKILFVEMVKTNWKIILTFASRASLRSPRYFQRGLRAEHVLAESVLYFYGSEIKRGG